MEKMKAKLSAFGRVQEGIVVKMGRSRVLIKWTSSTGRVRETWAKPSEGPPIEGPGGNGLCWLEKPLAKKGERVTLAADPDALPSRKVPDPVVYTPGSARARRQELLAQERELRRQISNCIDCGIKRKEAHRLVNMAEALIMACIEEAGQSRGRTAVKRLVYTEAPPNG